MSLFFKISRRRFFLVNIMFALALCLSCGSRDSQTKVIKSTAQVQLLALDANLKDRANHFAHNKCLTGRRQVNWSGFTLELDGSTALTSGQSLSLKFTGAGAVEAGNHKLAACVYKYYKLKNEIFLIARDGSGSFLTFHRLSLQGKNLGVKSFNFRQGELFEQNSLLNDLHQGRDRVKFDGKFLLREFPFYKPGDPNCCPSGGLIKVLYRYEKGYFSIKRSNVRGRVVL